MNRVHFGGVGVSAEILKVHQAFVTDSLTDSLTHSCLVDLIDVPLACEDANSKLVEVATVADVELRNVLTMVWCRFGS